DPHRPAYRRVAGTLRVRELRPTGTGRQWGAAQDTQWRDRRRCRRHARRGGVPALAFVLYPVFWRKRGGPALEAQRVGIRPGGGRGGVRGGGGVRRKEAWLRVEAGFRRGRQLILPQPETTLGRAEACALGLFGAPEVARLHARILRDGGRHMVEDMGSPAGTF